MRRCAPDEPSRRHRRRPDLRPHGGGHDFARAPTGIPPSWVTPDASLHPEKAQPRAGLFRFRLAPSPFSRLLSPTPMNHFLNTQDLSRAELDALLAEAARYKRHPAGDALKGKSIALVFFNASLRTRTSFELGAFQLGGHAVVLQPGKDAWPIEFDLGTVMDGE